MCKGSCMRYRLIIIVISCESVAFLFFFLLQLQEEGEEGKIKRPEVRDEDLIQARDKLASGTAVKSKTFEVMEECGEWSDDPVSTVTQAVYVRVAPKRRIRTEVLAWWDLKYVCVHASGLLVFPLHIK